MRDKSAIGFCLGLKASVEENADEADEEYSFEVFHLETVICRKELFESCSFWHGSPGPSMDGSCGVAWGRISRLRAILSMFLAAAKHGFAWPLLGRIDFLGFF
jgi:hypothetical protein